VWRLSGLLRFEENKDKLFPRYLSLYDLFYLSNIREIYKGIVQVVV